MKIALRKKIPIQNSSYRRNIGPSNRINMKPSHRSSKEFVPAQEGDMTNLGDSTTDVQVERRALVKKRNLTRSKITMLCNLMNDLVESRGSSMMLREQHQELEDLRKECKPLEQKLTDIYAETEDEEEYLKERLGEPPCACADFQPIPEKLVIDEHIEMMGSAHFISTVQQLKQSQSRTHSRHQKKRGTQW